jgi:hypothetical protein
MTPKTIFCDIDNSKPHDIDNCRISCYHCNCEEHTSYKNYKKPKPKCEENKVCMCRYI